MNIRELLSPRLLEAHHRPANRAGGGWYEIRAQAGDDDETRTLVDLYDVIGWDVEVGQLVRDLRAIDSDVIELHINSPGGMAFDGLTIYNALRDHPARVEAIVDGLAASAASFVLQAGESRTMNRSTQLMIHDALGLTIGDEADHLQMAELLGMTSDNIASIYAGRAGGTISDWRTAMRSETWYSPEEAVDAGLADQLVTNGDQSTNHSGRAQLVTARAHAHLERTA